MAYRVMADAEPRGPFGRQVLRMIDWLGPHQLTEKNCRQPEMCGGIDPRGTDSANIDTALQMIAAADGLAIARRLGDRKRCAKYEDMLRRGTRFVLQLEFRPGECYYVRSRSETVYGVRTAPWDHALLTENAQFALVALIKARQALFP
jgi:hypothetical protein